MSAALVVGGSSGIGRACAETLAAAGWDVAIADLRPPDDPPAGCRVVLQVDVRDPGAVDGSVAAAIRELGPLRGVVHAAGTARLRPLLEVTANEWDLVLGVNLTGAFHVLRAAAASLAAGGGGSIVAVSSVDAERPVAGLGPYCASKAGLESLFRVAALELAGSGVRVNVVAPGVVATPLMEQLLAQDDVRADFINHIPLARLGAPEDIASAVAFLLSDEASYVTGHTLVVDGGMSLREHARLLREPA